MTLSKPSIKDECPKPHIMAIELPVIEANLEIGTINLHTGEITPSQNGVVFNCSFSTDCCYVTDIPVTDFDIKRIEDRGYALDQIIEEAVPEIRFAKSGEAERHYWIKKKPFNNTCTFLVDNKCSIHEFKPFSCRIFPFQLVFQTEDIVKITIHMTNICKSVKGVPLDEAMNQQLLEDILNAVRREDEYRQLYFDQYGNN